MRGENRKPIVSCLKLPQFTIMNVIEGQAGLVIYSSLIFYCLTIDNILNIIVLIILAGVSISLVLGDNGIVTKAKDAKQNMQLAANEEQEGLANLEVALQEGISGGNSGTDPTTPYLPTGFSQVAETDLSTGLVIQDNIGNQYVWVEVPRTATVYTRAGTTLNLDSLSETELATALSNIETDLKDYATDYRQSGYTDEYFADSNEGWFAGAEAYNTAKNNMLKSVYKNGGFYIGRYETGIAYDDANSYRKASGDTTQTPVIKANAYPYNYVTRTQAQVLASSMNSGNYTSSLMFGIQWDLVLKYLETKGATQEELKGKTTGSTNWGNYYNATYNITNTNAKYSTNSGSSWSNAPYNKTKSGSTLLTTGADETRNSKQNICDLAGNVWEWTLEKTSGDNNPWSYRGGSYDVSWYVSPVSYRNYNNYETNSFNVGFRVSLY